MAGIHADRGDKSHRICSGEAPTLGMVAWSNDMERVTITKLATGGECGWYCVAWHEVTNAAGHRSLANCERLGTRHPGSGERA